MANTPRIAEVTVQKFIQLVEQGMQRKAAAREVGVGIASLRAACKRLNIPWPGRTLLKDRLKEYEPQILAGTISQHQLARELGCTAPRISKLFQELGYPALPSGRSPADAETQSIRDDLCEQVIDFIESKGGSIKNAVRALNLPDAFRFHVSAYARKVGFDLEAYRFAHRRYGYWLTLPGKAVPYTTSDYHLQAECTKCGTVHTVQLINLKTGASTQCRACASAARKGKPCSKQCRCVETGEIIPSIRKLSIRTEIPYSTVETKLINNNFQHDGLTYELCG